MCCHFLASRNYSKWRLQHFSLCSWKSAHRRVSAREVALYTWRRLKRCEYACASFDVSFKAPFNVFYGRKMCHKDCDEKLLWLTWSKSSCKLLTYEGSFLLVLVPEIYCFPGPKVKRFCREKKFWLEPNIDIDITSSSLLSTYRFSMKSTAFLTIIMTINWIFEIISFYAETSTTLFDIVNALQGVLIFLVFVCLPRPLQLIKHWWNDRGSFQVLDGNYEKPSNDIQMTSLCKQWWVCRKLNDGDGFEWIKDERTENYAKGKKSRNEALC